MLPTRTFTLRPLRREALTAVIEGPAQLAGIGVDEELVARLVADTDSGEALPLLAFTLAQLAEGVGRGGQLSGARYDQLGGVRGCTDPPGRRGAGRRECGHWAAPRGGHCRVVAVGHRG